MKARFKISLQHSDKYIALSNMPIINTRKAEEDSIIVDVYKQSPIMSTYLVVFVICDFEKRTVIANTTTKTNVRKCIFLTLQGEKGTQI